MEGKISGRSLTEIAALVKGEAVNDDGRTFTHPTSIDCPHPDGITFAESNTYLAKALDSDVGAVIVQKGANAGEKPHIVVESPRMAFGVLLHLSSMPLHVDQGVHPMAFVHPTAKVSASACVGPFAYVGPRSIIADGARVHGLAYVGEDCEVGAGTILHPHVVLVQNVKVGANCILFGGAVIGADGFGYNWDGKQHAKVPQVGGVVIGDNVEIGANSTVDRATAGVTRIGTGTKIDNLVQVGHNVSIGEHTVIASQVGLSGSTKVGRGVVMAGQAATVDHVLIGDGVVMAARAGATKDLTKPGTYYGAPAEPITDVLRMQALTRKLPEMLARIKALEAEIEALKK